MVYELPIDNLKATCHHLLNEAEARGVGAIDTRADGLYHLMCLVGRTMGLPENHPAVNMAEDIYMEALTMENATPAEKAFKIMHATAKLEEILFDKCLCQK